VATLAQTSPQHRFAPQRTAHPSALALLEADPDLAAGLHGEELDSARAAVVVPRLRIPAGPWAPELAEVPGPTAVALIVVDGLLRREVVLAGRRTAELFGPGDVVDPFAPAATEALVPLEVDWEAESPVTLAVLDMRFVAAARRWPALAVALHRRRAAQAARASVHLAIAQLGRVDLRVLALLWHLAGRWGVVTSDGYVLPLRMTHAALGRLVGAQRPTVTLALTELAERGDVTRRADGSFVLRPDSRELLAPR
jgi:CRP-like cAMP-binding protein